MNRLVPPGPYGCRICANVEGNKGLILREMLTGSREEFDYFQCAKCKSVEISDVQRDMTKYYSPKYYSMNPADESGANLLLRSLHAVVRRGAIRPTFAQRGRWFSLLKRWELTPPAIEAIGRIHPSRTARILDVGSGEGHFLLRLESLGYENLFGVDPFLPCDRRVGRVMLRKVQLSDLAPDELFDLIVLFHSLEHVPDPVATLHSVRAHLADAGTAIVAMPIVGWAFREYGSNWSGLEPPFHMHVFSMDGFRIALSRTGFTLSDYYFNSTSRQFRMSEQYSRDIPQAHSTGRFVPGTGTEMVSFARILSRREARLRSFASELNRANQGDQAVFYLGKSTTPAYDSKA